MIKIGSMDLVKAYLGASEIQKVYLGTSLVYQKQVAQQTLLYLTIGTPFDPYVYLSAQIYNPTGASVALTPGNSALPTCWTRFELFDQGYQDTFGVPLIGVTFDLKCYRTYDGNSSIAFSQNIYIGNGDVVDQGIDVYGLNPAIRAGETFEFAIENLNYI
ncbi:hypothetical protein SDC9_124290 [bioreactor metagenome]|uniref:Uncharacterized protein n=1 Tax=bioreactor metagenome TaxID=1076179 RepID=A0A645CK59_9ZZZZ